MVIRRFLRWLARREIEAEREQYEFAVRLHTAASDAKGLTAYLRGHSDGVQLAVETIERAIEARTGKDGEPATTEDLLQARKALTH